MSELVGRIVAGRYRVETFLGKGGMAEVYKVWDEERFVHLAMKVLYADLAEDKVFLRRFKREAQTLAKLQHPNIVRFYGLEQDDDLVYMLMDYVDGTTLRKEIFQAKEPFTIERILEVMKPVCAALYYAHKAGFVHCDVKPANIMLHKNGSILITDFGISRMTEAATVTMVGAGTPAYMSPEQVRGEAPVPQVDIYALGVILFEMLTGGERPFTGENAKTTGSTSEKIRWEQMRLTPPPPSKFNPSITSKMDEVVLKCLEKSPSSRHLSAMELLIDLTSQMAIAEVSSQATLISTQWNKESQNEEVQESVPEPSVPDNTNNTSGKSKPEGSPNLKLLSIVGISVLFLFMIIFGSVSFVYQRNMNATATADAKYLHATATRQAHDLFSTATKAEQYIRATATRQARNIRMTSTAQVRRVQSTATANAVKSMVPQEVISQFRTVRLFDSFNRDGNWMIGPEDNEFFAGNRTISAGNYIWRVNNVYETFISRQAVPNISIRDFYFQVDAQRLEGSLGQACYGLSFRDTADGYYIFEICDDQTYNVDYYSQADGWIDIYGWSSFTDTSDGMSQLGVAASESLVDLYINGVKVYSFTDGNSSGMGDLNLSISLFTKDSAAFEFDNVLILEP